MIFAGFEWIIFARDSRVLLPHKLSHDVFMNVNYRWIFSSYLWPQIALAFTGSRSFLQSFQKFILVKLFIQICTRNHGNHGITYTNSTLNNIFREEHSRRRSAYHQAIATRQDIAFNIELWRKQPFDILLILTISIHFDNVYAPILHTISCTRDYTIKLLRNAFLQSRMFRGIQLVSYRRSFFLWSASHCIYCRWYFRGC